MEREGGREDLKTINILVGGREGGRERARERASERAREREHRQTEALRFHHQAEAEPSTALSLIFALFLIVPFAHSIRRMPHPLSWRRKVEWCPIQFTSP